MRRIGKGMATATARNKTQTETLTGVMEFIGSPGTKLKVDRENGLINDVKIIGLISKNGRRYKESALRQAISLYEGAKVNVNHPKGNPLAARDYQDRLGRLSRVHYREGENGGLFGDLNYNPKHAIAEQLAWDAEHSPHNVGLSHNAEARTRKEGDVTVVESIIAVQSVDLVGDPATTSGLFESTNQKTEHDAMSFQEITLEQLNANRPDLVKGIVEKALESHRNSEEAKAKDKELADLRESVARHEKAAKARERRELVDKKLDEAKLPAQVDTDLFREQCYTADDALLPKLIEERQVLAKALGASTTPRRRPQSRDQQAVEEQETEGGAGSGFSSLKESLTSGE